ncbi:hypothetical protein [Thalassotalea mangrovi]|uniref:Uncharacterized protein n=1 Tax=Thalassotalea mangrovi TaxID=2572245 RepID=A0A4U1B891_9GAMM|nr:hypothetical protein [Thalassotalea mangrovi]TKB46163.1 hypothetical protein E8M12_05935 [Thalassotalea mangrovi]
MEQDSIWQGPQTHPHFHQLCHALYEREINKLSALPIESAAPIQAKLKSLSHYISRTAYALLNVEAPISIDYQNAGWASRQAPKIPIDEQTDVQISKWYQGKYICLGLVIPVYQKRNGVESIILDCIDRIDTEKGLIRCNYSGRFLIGTEDGDTVLTNSKGFRLLKPNRKVMLAACSGHRWVGRQKLQPQPLELRELLLSAQINWQNFKKVLPAMKY